MMLRVEMRMGLGMKIGPKMRTGLVMKMGSRILVYM